MGMSLNQLGQMGSHYGRWIDYGISGKIRPLFHGFIYPKRWEPEGRFSRFDPRYGIILVPRAHGEVVI